MRRKNYSEYAEAVGMFTASVKNATKAVRDFYIVFHRIKECNECADSHKTI